MASMLRPIILPYKMGSHSAKALAQNLGALRVYPDRNYKPKPNHLIINYGYGKPAEWMLTPYQCAKFLNWTCSVADATNKISAFGLLKEEEVSIPEYTTDKEVAQSWDGIVVCRTLVSSQEGRGIVIATNPDEIVDAPLYTKHVRHEHEFRVHVFKGSVIDFTQKKKRSTGEEANPYVRNSAGNWVFCREGVILPDDVAKQAVDAVKALGLDFGAVDVAYREREDKAFVLEVNTAPGLEGTTLERYTQAFKYLLESYSDYNCI
jgi:hypothetical protein